MIDGEGQCNRVGDLLDASGKRLVDLAAELGVSEDTARRLAKPNALVPSKYIAPLTRFFGVTADRLLCLDATPANQLALEEVAPS